MVFNLASDRVPQYRFKLSFDVFPDDVPDKIGKRQAQKHIQDLQEYYYLNGEGLQGDTSSSRDLASSKLFSSGASLLAAAAMTIDPSAAISSSAALQLLLQRRHWCLQG